MNALWNAPISDRLVRCVPGSSLLPPPYWKARRPWGRGWLFPSAKITLHITHSDWSNLMTHTAWWNCMPIQRGSRMSPIASHFWCSLAACTTTYKLQTFALFKLCFSPLRASHWIPLLTALSFWRAEVNEDIKQKSYSLESISNHCSLAMLNGQFVDEIVVRHFASSEWNVHR